jgi:hypothetical protein
MYLHVSLTDQTLVVVNVLSAICIAAYRPYDTSMQSLTSTSEGRFMKNVLK